VSDDPDAPRNEQDDPRYAILEGAPAYLWLGDVEGNCVFLNRAQREFWGVREDLADFSWPATLHPEDVDKLAGPYGAAMREQTAFEVEARYRRADGEWRILHTSGQPRFAKAGEFLGMVGVNTDVTDQRAAERSLRQTAEQLDFALDAAAGMGTWLWDTGADRLTGDRRLAAALDMTVEEAEQGFSAEQFLEMVLPEDRTELAERINEARKTGNTFRCEYRIRTAAGARWLATVGRCSIPEPGQPHLLAGITMEVGERKAREAQLDLLTRELAHRIRNIFTVLGAMVRLTAREHPAAVDALNEFEGRMAAMAAAYAHITPAADKPVAAGSLERLVKQIFAPYLMSKAPGIIVATPEIELNDATASSLALILHELATNSAKYGALACGGRVEFTVEDLPDGQLRLTWAEKGVTSLVAPGDRQGFGTRLIENSVQALCGTVAREWRNDGLFWQLTIPAAQAA
jgi:PAS domain S-box-containing protein